MSATGLREQKKAATRQALQQAALLLFEEHGFERTTVKDIAAAAGVTERTFFRYFPSKEDLVLGELFDLLPLIVKGIRGRPAAEPPQTAILGTLLALADARGSGLAILFTGPPARMMGTPTRPALPVLFEFENGIAEAVRGRLRGGGAIGGREDAAGAIGGDTAGDEDADLRAAVIARAAVSAMRSALLAHADRTEPDRPDPELFLDLLRKSFGVLGA
ncbi:TetR family transcriptional regulator [Streptomyces sp. NPDC051940]|uniref:TetR family transcriptional regulator n=1 Tax=Streptomyces sp. NPDC051940 TaxID=3155675 RepID=UPI00342C5E9A